MYTVREHRATSQKAFWWAQARGPQPTRPTQTLTHDRLCAFLTASAMSPPGIMSIHQGSGAPPYGDACMIVPGRDGARSRSPARAATLPAGALPERSRGWGYAAGALTRDAAVSTLLISSMVRPRVSMPKNHIAKAPRTYQKAKKFIPGISASSVACGLT
jgi:hypothetical protein